jgi:hypothetical protein
VWSARSSKVRLKLDRYGQKGTSVVNIYDMGVTGLTARVFSYTKVLIWEVYLYKSNES